MSRESFVFVKEKLTEYVGHVYGGAGQGGVDTASVQNKLTQTITYLFTALYGSGWESFFDDFLSFTGSHGPGSRDSLNGVVLFLRILNSIHDEIADVLVPRSGVEQKRNGELKDLVRAKDAKKLVTAWQEILNLWRENDGVMEMTLKVIGRWVSWIDISLVVNESLLNVLFQLAGRMGTVTDEGGVDKVRDVAIDTFTEIVSKKMKPADKIEMITFLNLENVVAQLVASPPLHDLRSTSSYDTDLAEAVAKLINNTVFHIVKTLDIDGLDSQVHQRADELLQTFLPHLLRFFSDEYDEICSTVIPSLTDLLTFFRKMVKAKGSLPSHHSAMLSPILNAIIIKMKYDETSSWGAEDEQTDEAEFQELRKRLQVLQQAVAVVDEALYINVLSNVVGNTYDTLSQRGMQTDWRDLDLALHEMFLFGELAVKNGGLYNKSQPSNVAAERLVVMMSKMVESG
jgi:exportin-T